MTTHIDYLIIGHVTQDRTDNKYVLGGTATYASLTACNLGQRVAVLTSAAFQPELVDLFSINGIQVARVPAEETTRFVNTYIKHTRQQHIEAQAEPLGADQLEFLPDWRTAAVVHLAPIADELQPDLIDAFPAALIGVTPQGWMRAWDDAGLIRAVEWQAADRVLARADAVILSEQDVVSPAEIDRYAALARLLVVTRGQRGASVYRDGEVRHLAAFQSGRQTDPTGAGDVFAAAFLVRLKETGDPFLSAEFANCVASFAIEKRHYNGVPSIEQIEERFLRGKRRKQVGPA